MKIDQREKSTKPKSYGNKLSSLAHNVASTEKGAKQTYLDLQEVLEGRGGGLKKN